MVQRLAASWPPRLQCLCVTLHYPMSLSPSEFARAAGALFDVSLSPPSRTDLTLDLRSVESMHMPGWSFDLGSLLLERRVLNQLRRLSLLGVALQAGPGEIAMPLVQRMHSLEHLGANQGQWPVGGPRARAAVRTDRRSRIAIGSRDSSTSIWSNTTLSPAPAHLAALAHLPELTSIQPRFIEEPALPLLAGCPLLRTLHVPLSTMSADHSVDLTSALFSHLRCGAHLTELHLNNLRFGPSHFAELAAVAPLLESLTLQCGSLSSLAGLSSLRRLRHLCLVGRDGLRSAHLDELQHATSLRTLIVYFSAAKPSRSRCSAREIDATIQAAAIHPIDGATTQLVGAAFSESPLALPFRFFFRFLPLTTSSSSSCLRMW